MEALFCLRAIYIPLLCHSLIIQIDQESEDGLLWLGPMAAYVIALERTMAELDILKRSQEHKMGKTNRKSNAGEPLESLLTRFENPPGGFIPWLEHFDQWRNYAIRSWIYYVSKQSKDVRKFVGSQQEAAVLGVLMKLESLPEKWFAAWKQGVFRDPSSRKILLRNARKSRYNTKVPAAEKDSWIIEIWPLVLKYNWSYRDAFFAFKLKFELPDRIIGASKKSQKNVFENLWSEVMDIEDHRRNFKAHCRRKLGLRTIPAREPALPNKKLRHGSKMVMPPMIGLAQGIDGIGANPERWIRAI